MTERTAHLHQRHDPALIERANAEAARRGITLTALVEIALEREIDASAMRAELDAARSALREIADLATPHAKRG